MSTKVLLQKVISGGQTGADEAGLFVAKRFGLQTGGTIPKGFKTLIGNRPELGVMYGLIEHESDSYVPRTRKNVSDSDGTVRLAGDFQSRGELLTLRSIKEYTKPHFDVDLADCPPPEDFVDWIVKHQIKTLNVAGNSNQTFKGCGQLAARFLTRSFLRLGLEMIITSEEIYEALGLSSDQKSLSLFSGDRNLADRLSIRFVG
jgi:hypothetical protein